MPAIAPTILIILLRVSLLLSVDELKELSAVWDVVAERVVRVVLKMISRIKE
jgi:hypothetical protein